MYMFNLENLLFVSSATIRPFAFLISFLYILHQLTASGYYLFHVQKTQRDSTTGRDIHMYRVLQTIQMKLILLCVRAERAVLGSAKTALKFKYEI